MSVIVDEMVEYCVDFLEAMHSGDMQTLREQWENILILRSALKNENNLEFWKSVHLNIQTLTQTADWTHNDLIVAMLVMNIRHLIESNLESTFYYETCEQNFKKNTKKPETKKPETQRSLIGQFVDKMKTSFLPMKSSNPYIVELR